MKLQKLVLFLTAFLFTSISNSQNEFAGLGHFFGSVTSAAIDPYNKFTNIVGQEPNVTAIFIDYRDPIYSSDQFGKQWVNNARFHAKSLKQLATSLNRIDENGNVEIIPIVSIGLVDDPTAYQLNLPTTDPNRGKYNEAASIQMMNDVAAGKYDIADSATGKHNVFPKILDAFRDNNIKKLYFRIGWEQNAPFFGWRVRTVATANAYNAAWRHLAQLTKQYAIDNNMDIKLVWSPTASFANFGFMSEEASYPGDDVVDIIGPDAYSTIFGATKFPNRPGFFFDWDSRQAVTLEQWYSNITNRKHLWDFPSSDAFNATRGWGIPKSIEFAIKHNKPYALSETGTGNKGLSTLNAGGPIDDGDYAYYLAERLNEGMAKGLKLEYVDIWAEACGPSGIRFINGNLPLEADSWRQFVNIFANKGINVGLNKSVTVSSAQNMTFLGKNTNDGKMNTLWNTNGAPNQFLEVDLGNIFTISKIKLFWSVAYAAGYNIQISNDRINWKEIYSASNENGSLDEINVTSIGRYIRLNPTNYAPNKVQFSLKEIEIYP